MRCLQFFVIAGILFLGPSLSLNAQDPELKLDQVELMKQFSGKWKSDAGIDTVFYVKFKPVDKGYLYKGYWQAKGETYISFQGVMGFTWKYAGINLFILYKDGSLSRDLGKFVTKDKIVMERFSANHENLFAKWEWTFLSPEKAKFVFTRRGSADDWSDAVVTSDRIFKKVKE